jgi:transposase
MELRHGLTDEQWAAIEPHLPPQKPATGRPNRPHREVVNAIRWRLRTGTPWRDLPPQFGPWQTIYSRFRRWEQAGVWARLLAALQAEADGRGELDWSLHLLDGTVIRAHAHAAGAKKGAAIKPSGAPAADFPPKSTSAPTDAANRSPGC